MRRSTLTALALIAAFAMPADAGMIHWRVKAVASEKVQLKFFSQNSDHVWPSRSQVWELLEEGYYTFRLECHEGEKICLGASAGAGERIWGVGLDGEATCTDCCRVCGERNVHATVLSE